MKMQVDAEQCIGCGACVEKCPNRAIQMIEGLAVLDQAACTQCQACADICPAGAIAAVELPVAVTEPVAVQPVREAEIAVTESIPSSPKPWLSAVLAFAGREILPRLADALLAALDRRLAQTQLAQPQAALSTRNIAISLCQNSSQGYRQRRRYGQNRQWRRGQVSDAGKRNWT